MLKLTLRAQDGRATLLLGVNEDNMRRLASSQPIRFSGEEVGIPAIAEIIVIGGVSNEAMVRAFIERGLLPPETLEKARQSDRDPTFRYRRRSSKAEEEVRPPSPPLRRG